MANTISIEEFKFMNGINEISIKLDDFGSCIQLKELGEELFIPIDIDLTKSIYVSKTNYNRYSLSNYGQFNFEIINDTNEDLFREVSEGIFRIERTLPLDVFCNMNNINDAIEEKLEHTMGNYFSISGLNWTFILHPYLTSNEAARSLSQLSICQLGNSLFEYWFIFPNKCNRITIPTNFPKLDESIKSFKPSTYGGYAYTQKSFSDIVHNPKSPYYGLTYQDVILKTQSLSYLYFCIVNLNRFIFNVESKLLGVFSIIDFYNNAKSDTTKESLDKLIKLLKFRADDFVSFGEFISNKKNDYHDNLENESEFQSWIKDGIDSAFESDFSNEWNIN